LRGREPKQHTALPKKTKTTATPPEQEQRETPIQNQQLSKVKSQAQSQCTETEHAEISGVDGHCSTDDIHGSGYPSHM
jgi:hypothetical protein